MPRLLAAPIAALVRVLIACGTILAHEHRQVGGYEMIVGWIDEPARPGIYAFRFVGAITDQKINEVFTASPRPLTRSATAPRSTFRRTPPHGQNWH